MISDAVITPFLASLREFSTLNPDDFPVDAPPVDPLMGLDVADHNAMLARIFKDVALADIVPTHKATEGKAATGSVAMPPADVSATAVRQGAVLTMHLTSHLNILELRWADARGTQPPHVPNREAKTAMRPYEKMVAVLRSWQRDWYEAHVGGV